MAKAAIDDVSDFLTSDEVLDRLMSDVRLRRVALTCVLPAVRSAGKWRFRKSDLEEWIEQNRQPFKSATN
jgi:helix-turn-helix protein